jgi:hypothetical protein
LADESIENCSLCKESQNALGRAYLPEWKCTRTPSISTLARARRIYFSAQSKIARTHE